MREKDRAEEGVARETTAELSDDGHREGRQAYFTTETSI